MSSTNAEMENMGLLSLIKKKLNEADAFASAFYNLVRFAKTQMEYLKISYKSR